MKVREFIVGSCACRTSPARKLAKLRPYPAQAAMFDAVDTRDGTGQRQYREIVISLPKKFAKSTSCAVLPRGVSSPTISTRTIAK